MKMRCPGCDHDNPGSNVYCERCGLHLAQVCVRCGRSNSSLAQFCGGCGAVLEAGMPSEPAAEASSSRMQGERKQATILFADIVGSTQLVAGLDPEEAIARLRPTLEIMSGAARQFGSTVVHFLGDGIMAVFGAPQAHERHAFLACSAALTMQEAANRGGNVLPLRIGLHSGIVVAGALEIGPTGDAARGAAVFLARRMQELAQPGEIVITADCYRLVRGYCDAQPLGHRSVKGFGEAIEVYRLLRQRRAATSEQFRAASLTPFRGRTRELAALERALVGASEGHGHAIGISAGPGAGKSRLCYEFGEWCRGQGIPIIEARALPYSHATPYQPVLELLRSFFQTSDTAATARVRIARVLLALDPAFEVDLHLVYEFLGVANPDERPPPLDPKVRQARLRNILHRIVRSAGVKTSVIIFEDLHWLDEASSDLVQTLVESVAGTRILLVLNYRPSFSAPWMSQRHFEEFRLPDFDPDNALALVQNLVGHKPELAEICRRIAERSSGNPFFVEELINSLEESGELRGEPGNYELGKPASERSLPATVQAAIGARIDRIAAEDKDLLQIAAVIGTEFPVTVVQQIAQKSANEIEKSLARLYAVELVQRQVGAEAEQFMFRHPLIQEVAYVTQLKSRRATLHAAAAAALADFYKERADEFAGLLAYHCEAAGQNVQAAKYGAKAARWLGKTDSAQALKHYKTVRALLEREPKSNATEPYRLSATLQILNFGWRQGMTAEEARPFAEEARAMAGETGNKLAQTMALVAFGRIIAASGAADEYVRLAREALSLIANDGNSGRAATLNAALSQALYFAGLLDEALAANSEALRTVPFMDKRDTETLGFDVEQWIMGLRARILVQLGRFSEAEEWLQKLLQIKTRNPIVQYIPHSAYVDLAWCRGDARLAMAHAARVSEIADHSTIPYLQVHASAALGIAETTAGEHAKAVQNFTRAIDFARGTNAGWENEPGVLAHLAGAYWQMGEGEKALATAAEALQLAERRTARVAALHASLVSSAALAEKDRAAAERFFRRAEYLSGETGAALLDPLRQRIGATLFPQTKSRSANGPKA